MTHHTQHATCFATFQWKSKLSSYPQLLPPAYGVRREGTVFTGVCLSTPGGGGGVPHFHPMSFPGGTPSPYHNTSTGPMSLPGGYPLARSGWGEGGTPVLGWGTPLARTTEGVLATQRAVCLLHSRRRTFLLPPAYVVRREGNSFTLYVSSHLGGGVRSVSQQGGVRMGGGLGPAGGVRSVSWWGGGVRSVSQRGGGGGVRSSQRGGGGQHLAPSCGRYASCVHAGGLSCLQSSVTCK